MLAGVAGGMAEYCNVDPIIVRIAFVVLTLFGGVGLVLYGSGWLLMSDRDQPSSARELFNGSRRHQAIVAVAAVLIGIVTLDFVSRGPFWFGGGWRVGHALGWIVIAGVIGYLVLRGARGAFSVARVLRRISLSFLGLVAVLLLATVVTDLATGVPLSGGFGSRTWRPTSVRQMSAVYRDGIGNAALDLRDVTFPDRLTQVTVSVGIGRLLVEVPPGVTVSLIAHCGIGNVSYGPGGQSAFLDGGGVSAVSGSRAALLVLNAQAGIGQVELVRSAPDPSLAMTIAP
jgi:phage shock protein PspC (stress-responsive transcriptional regulator)